MAKATIATTKGDIEVEIFTEGAPKAAGNFLDLAEKGFYDGVIFHRVVPGFVIQGGDPTGTGRGGPGYQFDDEPFVGDYVRGALAMANAGPNTNGSQFFICLEDLTGRLPKNYTLFGQVMKGMDVVDAIAADPTGPGDRPVTPVAMTTVSVTER
jgi:cyclophilin family peptidyl-prolyl cis-trans isomerase